MIQLETKILEEELKYKGTVILKYKIEYPQITETEYKRGKQIFNLYNLMRALELKLYVEKQLFEEAKQTYEYNTENGYPIMVYEVIKNYEITYKTEKMVSLYTDQYIFSGGAHGNTIRKSQNWDISKARQIPLNELYSNNPNYVLDILKKINQQIQERLKENPSTYFDNYCRLVIETINLENYYRISNKIVIFFQQYDIAPYSTGIPTFEIII